MHSISFWCKWKKNPFKLFERESITTTEFDFDFKINILKGRRGFRIILISSNAANAFTLDWVKEDKGRTTIKDHLIVLVFLTNLNLTSVEGISMVHQTNALTIGLLNHRDVLILSLRSNFPVVSFNSFREDIISLRSICR